MGWTMFYLFVALKMPIIAAIWLVWWAVKQEPDPSEDVRDDGGTKRRPHPIPRLPQPSAPRPARRARSAVAAAGARPCRRAGASCRAS